MKPARRDPLRELVQLLRFPEEGACNLGAFLAEHADELAPALNTRPSDLRESADMTDEVVAPRLRARRDRMKETERERREAEDMDTSLHTAAALGGTARWTERGAVLDTDVLLGDLLIADRSKKYVAFAGSDFTTTVERRVLHQSASLRRLFIDVAAYVDAGGVHIRWRGGRGGFNWRSHLVDPQLHDLVLTVRLQSPTRAAVPRPGAWLGDLLQEMGFAV
jgi:hypothetical protein